jgi:hypothetical protein
MKTNMRFAPRGPDRMSEELATVLSENGTWEFKSLFDVVHANLRSKDFARGGEEMMRLRAHEKLQNFLHTGVVTKKGKEYTGVPKGLAQFFKTASDMDARREEIRQSQVALALKDSQTGDAGAANFRKSELRVQKAQERDGNEGQKGKKAAAQGR